MPRPKSKLPAILALVAALLGLLFASNSTLDYAKHLDRRLHDVHCSFIPGAPATDKAEACRVAMYSPYSALFREKYWGGIPISLFALGAFAFYAAFAVYLLVHGSRAPKRALRFFGVVSVAPLVVSLVMFTISVTRLGTVCKTCAGIYISSILLAVAGVMALLSSAEEAPGEPRAAVGPALPLIWLVCLGATALMPALVYAASAPDERPYLTKCGELKVPKSRMTSSSR